MSFFGKFKTGNTPNGLSSLSPSKKDQNAPQLTNLEKHLVGVTGPTRIDGSDKFYGFENYGSTCYCNSIIQCLYYSAPFREHVISFPPKQFLDNNPHITENGSASVLPLTATTPYPNLASPARKPNVPTSPAPAGIKPEDNKDSPENRKRLALQAGPVLDMTSNNSTKYGMQESLFTSLRDIFEAIIAHKSRIGVVSPHRFLEILRRDNEMFRSAMHQDAHEFLNLLLNQVVDNVELFAKEHPDHALPRSNGAAKEAGTFDYSLAHAFDNSPQSRSTLDAHWVHDLFEGLLTSETRCLSCETTSQRDEAFLDLSVDLSTHTSVTSCLRKFSVEEMLCERDKFHCDTCGGLQEAEKRMKVKRLPRILALHLKRFKYTEDLQRLQKLFHRIVYPFYLRLFNTTDDAPDTDRVYELYAVVVHIGGGPYHGHYVSIIKTKDRGWLLFDDELVEPVDKSYVMNFFGGEPVPGLQDARQLACAYVLFYQETTEEAMEAELAAEGTAASARTSDVETAKGGLSPVSNAADQNVMIPPTPSAEDIDYLDPLAHANTAPASTLFARPHLDHLTSTPGPLVMPTKSKKELRQEEKDRKAEEKDRKAKEAAESKAESKLQDEKRRAMMARRLEDMRKQQDELSAVLEASKQTASAEDAHRKLNDPAPASSMATIMESTGLSRFRNGSMSIRNRPKFFGGKEKEKEPTPAVSTPPLSLVVDGKFETFSPLLDAPNGHEQNGSLAATSSLATSPAVAALKEDDSKVKKNRFSLGRKRSTMLGG